MKLTTITFDSENKKEILKALQTLEYCLFEVQKNELLKEDRDFLILLHKKGFVNDWMQQWNEEIIKKLQSMNFVFTRYHRATSGNDVDRTDVFLTEKGEKLVQEIK